MPTIDHWLCARLWYLQCICTGDTTVSHKAIDIMLFLIGPFPRGNSLPGAFIVCCAGSLATLHYTWPRMGQPSCLSCRLDALHCFRLCLNGWYGASITYELTTRGNQPIIGYLTVNSFHHMLHCFFIAIFGINWIIIITRAVLKVIVTYC